MSRAVSSTSWSRRGLLHLAGATSLAGCGFRPLYGPPSVPDDAPTELRQELAAIRVGVIPERFGQLLRRDLQRRFEGLAPGTPARYLLTVGVTFDIEVLGYRRDGAISRLRYIATANWNLATQSVPPRILARSAAPLRVMDAFNVPDLQFFAADTAREATEARLVERLGNDIAHNVTLQFRQRAENPMAQAPEGTNGPDRAAG